MGGLGAKGLDWPASDVAGQLGGETDLVVRLGPRKGACLVRVDDRDRRLARSLVDLSSSLHLSQCNGASNTHVRAVTAIETQQNATAVRVNACLQPASGRVRALTASKMT
eukprot:1778670-Rhodomonas_salina.2